MEQSPPSAMRTILLLAGLLIRRFFNRWKSGLRRRKKSVAGAAPRAGTGRKGSVGWIGVGFIAVIISFNSINITSRVLLGVRSSLGPRRDTAGKYEVSMKTEEALSSIEERLEGEKPDASAKAAAHKIFTDEISKTVLDDRERENITGEMQAQFLKKGADGFTWGPDDFFLPRIHAWEVAAASPVLWKVTSALVMLLVIAWFCMDLGSRNQDLGRVEWTLEWLFTFPVPSTSLFAAQILGFSLTAPVMWCVAWPMLTTIFVSAGWGWWSVLAGATAAFYLGVLIGSTRVAIETLLRSTCSLSQMKNLQALFTVLGVAAFYLLVAASGTSSLASGFFITAARLPEAVTWLPFSVLARLPALHLAGPGLTLSAMAGSALFFPFASVALCSSLVRGGLMSVSGAYAGKRQPGRIEAPKRDTFLQGITGKDVRLLLRDRNFLVQTLVVPVLIIGLQVFMNAGIIDAVRTKFQHAAVLAFSVGAYVLIATALSVLSVEGNSLWMLYTFPRSLTSILFQKTKLWCMAALCYTLAVLVVCGWLNPGMRAADVTFALIAIAGVVIYAFIASGIGILATDPLETEVRRRVRPEMAQLYMMLAAMYANALYAPSMWARLGQIILSTLLAYALWQKVRDRAPFFLDPVAAPPPSISLADGMIAALAFFVLQGMCSLFLMGIKFPPGPSLFIAFVTAGGIVMVLALYIFARNKVPHLMRSVGFERDMRDSRVRYMRVRSACGLGIMCGLAAAGFAWLYLQSIDFIPALKVLKSHELGLQSDVGWWLPAIAVFAAPVFEEFIFRGLVFRGLRRTTNAGVAIFSSAAIFAIVHPAISVIPVFMLGVVAAWSFERSKLLISAISAHAVYNAAVVAMNWRLH